jgi:DHA1 family tetracycline resistance protein-like MFS transporter
MEQRSAKSALALVALIVFLDMTGVGIIIPVLPGLITELSHETLQNAALIGGGLLFAYSAMLFFCAPIVGGLSDRFGRRPVLLLTLAAMGIDYFLMAWAPTLVWLLIGRLISGAAGATWAAANSCIADLFPPEERGAKFGLLGGAGAAGFVLGPAVGGLLGEIGLRLPFIAAGTLALAGALGGYFLFAEPLPAERRRAFDWKRANPLGTLLRMRRIKFVIGLIAVIFLITLASQATMTTWAFYLLEKFRWSPLDIGVVTAVYGMLLVVVQGGLTGKIIARFGAVRTATLGFCASIPAFAILAVAPTGLVVYLGVIIGACAGLTFPALQSLMSERVDGDAQGELQGAVASTISIAALAGPLIMPPVFAAFTDGTGLYLPGAPFVLSVVLTLAGWLLFVAMVRRHMLQPDLAGRQ